MHSLFFSQTKKFKYKFTKTYNLMINYSFNRLNVKDDVALKQIEANYLELIDIATEISNPMDSYFNIYLMSTSTKISIGSALLMLTNALEFLNNGEPISKIHLQNIILYAQKGVKTEEGKFFIKKLLEARNSN